MVPGFETYKSAHKMPEVKDSPSQKENGPDSYFTAFPTTYRPGILYSTTTPIFHNQHGYFAVEIAACSMGNSWGICSDYVRSC